ncbi:hypothetical protein Rs2_42408 [Raphanus sativus]|nr:hypothetical protein Rs2_42408 [Raphanus sativus]
METRRLCSFEALTEKGVSGIFWWLREGWSIKLRWVTRVKRTAEIITRVSALLLSVRLGRTVRSKGLAVWAIIPDLGFGRYCSSPICFGFLFRILVVRFRSWVWPSSNIKIFVEGKKKSQTKERRILFFDKKIVAAGSNSKPIYT